MNSSFEKEMLLLSRVARHLYLFLITTTKGNEAGCFKMSMSDMSTMTLISENEVYDALYELQQNKLATYDIRTSYVHLLNFVKNQSYSDAKLKKVFRVIEEIDDGWVKKAVFENSKELRKVSPRRINRPLESDIDKIILEQKFSDITDRWNNFALYTRLDYTPPLTGDLIVKITNMLLGLKKANTDFAELIEALRLVLSKDSRYKVTFEEVADGKWVEIFDRQTEILTGRNTLPPTSGWEELSNKHGFKANSYEEFIEKISGSKRA